MADNTLVEVSLLFIVLNKVSAQNVWPPSDEYRDSDKQSRGDNNKLLFIFSYLMWSGYGTAAYELIWSPVLLNFL